MSIPTGSNSCPHLCVGKVTCLILLLRYCRHPAPKRATMEWGAEFLRQEVQRGLSLFWRRVHDAGTTLMNNVSIRGGTAISSSWVWRTSSREVVTPLPALLSQFLLTHRECPEILPNVHSTFSFSHISVISALAFCRSKQLWLRPLTLVETTVM